MGDLTKPTLSIHYAITIGVAVIMIGIVYVIVRWGTGKVAPMVSGVSPAAGNVLSQIGSAVTGNPNIPSQS